MEKSGSNTYQDARVRRLQTRWLWWLLASCVLPVFLVGRSYFAEKHQTMTASNNQSTAQAAWDRIEALGGSGVWERETVFVSFAKSKISDDDLTVFRDFPLVQTLDLSNTNIGDAGLAHLQQLAALESLILVNTKVSPNGLSDFRRTHPNVEIRTEPIPEGKINPFTGQPL